MNKTGAFLLLIIVGGVIGASALFLMTPKPVDIPKNVQLILSILDEGKNKDNSLQIKHEEENQKTIYLKQTINCIEVKKEQQTLVFMDTMELTITNVSFTDTVGDGTGDDRIVISFVNSGSINAIMTIVQVNFNGVTQIGNWELSGENSIGRGIWDSLHITADWTPGNNYSIEFVTTDGKTMVGSFTCTV